MLIALVVATILMGQPAKKGHLPKDRPIATIAASASDLNDVDLTAKKTEQADAGKGGAGSNGGSRGGSSSSTAHAVVLDEEALRNLARAGCVGGGTCTGFRASGLDPVSYFVSGDPTPSTAASPGASARQITVSDLAHFLPADVRFHAEPDGWAVVGVPANFWTYVTPVTVEGQLLGEEAAVRFTPRLYQWRYGDGSTSVTTTGGSSWAGLGQEELTPTATSHVYSVKQQVQASVTVIWSADYRFAGGDWIRVDGAVSDSSPAQRILVVKERTVLTAH